MRHVIPCCALAAAILAASPAYAWYDYQHNTHDSLVWRSQGESLQLRSGHGSHGVSVIELVPTNLWGLHKGDVIQAVDGQPVQDVDQLLERLYASKPAVVAIAVRRGNAERMLKIPAADYTRIVSPQPPTPPAPPAM